MKKFVLLFVLLALAISLTACSVAIQSKPATTATAPAAPAFEPIAIQLTESDYEYVIYGELVDIRHLTGNDEIAVAAIRPVEKGGATHEDYPWVTAFIADAKTLATIEGATREGENYWELTVKNCEDSGGFIELPAFIVEAKAIDADDIPPSWGGA